MSTLSEGPQQASAGELRSGLRRPAAGELRSGSRQVAVGELRSGLRQADAEELWADPQRLDADGGCRGLWRFETCGLRESTAALANPSGGWYHLYPFALEREPDFEELHWCLYPYPTETLALAMVDIGAYRSQRIPQESVERFSRILDFFTGHEKEMIVRIVYDRQGQGLSREPEHIGQIKEHMEQLGPVIRRHGENILLTQGLFVGSWGELHGSKYLAREELRSLAETWRRALGPQIPVTVRTPQQWRMLHRESDRPEDSRMGLFNDGMFGSALDLGTYGTCLRRDADWEDQWCREDELSWMEAVCDAVPYGGEAVAAADNEGDFVSIVRQMRRLKLCYLNASFDERRLSMWRQELWQETGVWDGTNGYNYIGAHLGFRPVIREVTAQVREQEEILSKSCVSLDIIIEICIENVGFSLLREPAGLLLCLKEAERGDCIEQTLLLAPEALRPERIHRVCCRISGVLAHRADRYEIYLRMHRVRDGKSFYFANDGGGSSLCLGSLFFSDTSE